MSAAPQILWKEEIFKDELFRLDEIKEGDIQENAEFVESTLATIRDDNHLIDDVFKQLCNDILNAIDNERLRLGIRTFSRIQKIILLHELYYGRERYKDEEAREDGSDTYLSHIMGALRIQIQALGITGLSPLLAAINHDVLEDFVDKRGIHIKNQGLRKDIESYVDILSVHGGPKGVDLGGGYELLEEYEKVLPGAVKKKIRAFFGVGVEENAREIIRKRDAGELKRPGVLTLPALHAYIESTLKKNAVKLRQEQEDVLSKKLLHFDKYAGKIDGFDLEEAQTVAEEVRALVRGVTKIKKDKDTDTTKATLVRTLEEIYRRARTAYVKLPDRIHNSDTWGGHRGLEKRVAKAYETGQVYLLIARILHLRHATRFLVDNCVKYLNPELKNQFETLLASRLREWSERPVKDDKNGKAETCEVNVRKRLQRLKDKIRRKRGNLVDFKIVPKGLDYYTSFVDKPLSDIDLSELQISDSDPMFEIVILTEPGAAIGQSEQDRLLALKDIKDLVTQEFGSLDGGEDRSRSPRSSDPDKFLGVTLRISNEALGGKVIFRINDKQFEARSKRGALADFRKETPAPIANSILDVLNRIRGYQDVLHIAAQELLKPRVRVLTKKHELREFPWGANAFDLAAAVHTSLLIGLQGVVVEEDDDLTGRIIQKRVDPFKALEYGKRYVVSSFITERKATQEAYYFLNGRLRLKRINEGGEVFEEGVININPGYQAHVQNEARVTIKRFFHSLDQETAIVVGRNYFVELMATFGLEGHEQVVMAELKKAFVKRLPDAGGKDISDQQFYLNIGRCDVIPLEDLIVIFKARIRGWIKDRDRIREKEPDSLKETVFRAEHIWDVEFEVPEITGSLSEFSREFSADVGIQIDQILKHEKGRMSKPGKMVFRFDLDKGGITLEKFVKIMHQISYKYNLKIVHRPWQTVLVR